jgi:hypothetical protein
MVSAPRGCYGLARIKKEAAYHVDGDKQQAIDMGRPVILKLANLEDLERTAASVAWLNRPQVEKVLVMLPWLDADEQNQSATALHHLFNDCGCIWGSLAFLIVFIGAIGNRIIEGDLAWSDVGLSLLLGAFIGFLAKLLRLAWSRWRLTVWLRRMKVSGETRHAR